MQSKGRGNVSIYKAWSRVALNYHLRMKIYDMMKTSGNEEDKKNDKRWNLAVVGANISQRKAEEKDRTFFHFIMRLTSSFLPINFRDYDRAVGTAEGTEKESTSGRKFPRPCSRLGIERENEKVARHKREEC